MIDELKATLLASNLTDSQLEMISEKCSRETLSEGQQLCSYEDVLDKLYIVQKGCLKAVVGSRDQKRVAGFVNAGEALGQYCVLQNEPALADIFAEFDSVLLTIDRQSVISLIEEIPQLRDNLSRTFRQRLRTIMRGEKVRRLARVVAIVRNPALADIFVSKISQRLADRGERVVVLTQDRLNGEKIEVVAPKFGDHFSSQIAELQSRFDRVILDLPAVASGTFFDALRHCNEVLWCFEVNRIAEDLELLDRFFDQSPELACQVKRICCLPKGETAAPWGVADTRIRKRDFILPLSDAGDDRRMHRQGIDRITRHLCDVKIGLSMAGGGARGLVHFGILRALDRAGISFDFMSGTSAGSMFGLSYATGLDTEYLINAYHQNLTPPWYYRWMPNGDRWFLVWKFRSRGWDKMLRKYFDWKFEQIPIPFSSVAVDLVSGKQVVSESGDIIEAMLASLNLPLIAKPILKDGMALVDGGVLNNLPADVLKEKNADYVVGVVVSSDLKAEFGINRPGAKTSEMRPAGRLETMFRLLEVMGSGTKEVQRSAIDLLIRPDTSPFSFTDFTNGEGLAAVGEAVMEQAIPELKMQLDELMKFKRT